MFWVTSEGEELLQQVTALAHAVEFDPVRLALKLQDSMRSSNLRQPESRFREAIELVLARAEVDFLGGWACQGYFRRKSIEQATRPEIARHHAEQFRGCTCVLEIGTGSGVDTAALARVAKSVTTIEQSPLLASYARENLKLQGIQNVTVLEQMPEDYHLQQFDGLWADPSRRTEEGRRIYNPEHFSPPLSSLLNLPIAGPRGIKVGPGLNLSLNPGWSREWIGFKDACVEQTLWYRSSHADGSVFLASQGFYLGSETLRGEAAMVESVANLSGYLLKPHAALIRSGHLAGFWASMGALRLDSEIAYGSCPTPVAHPLVTSFRILETFPYNLKRLSQHITARGWSSRSEILKRGIEIEPETLKKQIAWSKRSTGFGTVVLVRAQGDHWAILAERVARESPVPL